MAYKSSSLVDKIKQMMGGVPQTLSDIGNAIQPKVMSPVPQYSQPTQTIGYKANNMYRAALQPFAAAQNFLESPKPVQFGQFQAPKLQNKASNFIAGAGTGLANIGVSVADSIINKGIVNPTLDIANMAGRTLGGRSNPNYKNLRSSQARLGYNIMGNNANTQQVIGNVAGSVLPVFDAYGGGKVFGFGKTAIEQGGKQLFKEVIKQGAKTGAQYGGVGGALQGLSDGRNAENLFKQLQEGITSGVIGTSAGAALGGVTIGAGYVIGQQFGRLISKYKKVNPQAIDKEATQAVKTFVRDEVGRFAGKNKKNKKEPPFYGDMRESLGLPRDGDYNRGFIKPDEIIGGKPKTDPTEALKVEARKYKSAEEFVKGQTKQDYRSAHQLGLSDSITADKIDMPTLKEGIRTRNGYLNKYNLTDLKRLEKLQNNPDAEVTIYRASPKNELNDGDWVTTDKTYANDIKKQNGGKVYSYTAKVKDLRFPKDLETLPSLSMASTFSYSPKTSQLTDIWNKATLPEKIPAKSTMQKVDTMSLSPIVLKTPINTPRIKSTPVMSSRTTLKKSITNNPIKDDISGVKPSGIVTKLREVVQDNWIRAKNLQRQKGVKVTDKANPYLKEELYHGRVGARIENIKSSLSDIDKDMITTSKKLNIPDATLRKNVNKYLQATHAPERNAALGDGAAGMTNKQATETLKNLKNLKEVKRIANTIQDMNKQTLDILLEQRVIGRDLYNQLRTKYKNHVPLNRVINDADDIVDVLTNKGFNVKGSGIKRAKGSDLEVADIFTNVASNLEAAVVRAEKNRVNLATLEFARANKQLGVFEEIRPRAIGKTFDGKIITQQVKDPQVLHIMEDGKPIYLKINDPKLAQTFQGIGNERLPSVFKFVNTFTRVYSGLHTRFNPEFAASNIIRDTQEMAVFMASQKDIGFTGTAKTLGKTPASIKTIMGAIMGKDSPDIKLYKQMQLDGGTTGGMALSTRKQVEIDLEAITKLNKSKPRQAAQGILEGFDKWNTVFEDSTRFSVYKQALENGMSREQAASLAKNATVNFNKKGTGGPIINSLYMFSNASIQGSTKMLKAMKNPKVAATVVTMVGTSVFATNNWNDMIDPDWRDKVTEWDRNSNMVVMLPSQEGSKYITIPVSWGIKPLKVASDVAYDISSGHTSNLGDAAVKIASSAFDAYNPAGGEDIMSSATPTFLDTPLELARNKSWSGGIIKPDWLKGLPNVEQRFADTDKTLSGRIAIKTTEGARKASGGLIDISPNDLLYAYRAYIGGIGKAATRVVNTSTSLIKGTELKASEVPFSNRFYKTQSEEQTQKSVIKRGQNEFFNSFKKYETGSEEQKEIIRDYLKGMGSDKERQGVLFKLRDQGFDTKGISYSGKKLGVPNVPLQSEKVSFQDTKDQPQNILDKIALAAQGMTKDPETTIKAIFTQEELRKIRGNAVILKRQDFLNKEKDPNLQRDHIIPLGLGGDNSEENLKYVPKEWHEAKTKNDNRLIKELQSGKITRQEAQEQVKEWIEKNPHKEYVMEKQVSDKSYDYTDDKGKVKTIELVDITNPTLTGNTELDKKLVSKFNSAITAENKKIMKLFEMEKITGKEAEALLQKLIDLKAKVKKSTSKGKAKKLTKLTFPKITARSVSRAKLDLKMPTIKVADKKKLNLTLRNKTRTMRVKV